MPPVDSLYPFSEHFMSGLLGNILGAVMGGGAQQAQQGGLGGILSSVMQNPQMMNAITGMLSNDGGQGGLGGMMAKFQQAGMGDVVNSWVGSGDNMPINADQLSQVLGSDTLSNLAQQMGMQPGDAAGQLSQALPDIINALTPNGQAPEGGLGNMGDLAGMLGGLLKR
jgi:uncharacterized protein YidB (DUF937 family)